MTNGIKMILAIASGLVLLCFVGAGVQTWRLDSAQDSIAAQAKDIDRINGQLADAQEDAARWQATAKAHAVFSEAQADLAAACIKREEQVHSDTAELASILSAVKSETITPEQARKGVDDATRQRIADMLNRPL